jgi:enoyl-[acyl-carrier protein] reductase II
LYPDIEAHISIIIEEGVRVVFTSAGSPKKYTSRLQSHGIKVVHVIASKKFALKSVEAGVDAIVAEGFEAGGHNGVEEITTMCLIPMIKDVVKIPVIAAGGIGGGRAMLAAIALGADGVQMGSRFIASDECSAHINFKNKVVNADEGETDLTLKELTAVRLMKNKFYNQIQEAYANDANKVDLRILLGRGRAKIGMFEGDLDEGELEVGQVSAMINKIMPVAEIIKEITDEYEAERMKIISLRNLNA